MSYQKTTPSGDVFIVPERGDPDWGANATAILDRSLDSLQSGDLLSGSELVITPLNLTVSNGDHINETGSSLVVIKTNGQDVTLDAVAPITSPVGRDGKLLEIINVDNTFLVTIPDAGNTNINGGVTLGYMQSITVRWLGVVSMWSEVARNN